MNKILSHFVNFFLLIIMFNFLLPVYAQEEGEDEIATDDAEYKIKEDEDSVYEENEGLQWSYGGKIESVHGIGLLKEAEYLASRNFVNAYLGLSYGNSYAKIGAVAEYNYRNPTRTGFRLTESFYKYRNRIFEFCIGRQQIVWGQADGFTLTNVISGKDAREFTATTNDDSSLPSDGIRLKFFTNIFTFDAVAIPFFTPNAIPPFSFELSKNKPPFYIDLPDEKKVSMFTVPIYYTKKEAEMPRMFVDTEVGVRFAFSFPKIDFSFSSFYGWEKTPIFVSEGVVNLEKKGIFLIPVPTSINVNIQPEYYRIAMLGTDGAIPIGDVLLRYEASYVWGRYFEPKEQLGAIPTPSSTDTFINLPFNRFLRKHQLLLLAGIDWNYEGWYLSAQYFEDLILDYTSDIRRPLHQGTISLNLSKSFFRETLKLGITEAIGVNYGDIFSTYSLDYALTDNLHLETGFDIYTEGLDGKGQFAKLKDLSTYWIRGKFSF